MNVTIWNEGRHEQRDQDVRDVYPKGIHGALADYLETLDGMAVRTATLDDPEHGLPQEVVDSTDVMLWWSHIANDEVSDEVIERVHAAVERGMGLILLHSAVLSRMIRRVLGTSCGITWREDELHERLWVVDPTHPIAAGVDRFFEIPKTEMYGEYFDVPTPDELVFISWFAGGEVFRSGMVWKRGRGRVFYFRPGHETLPIYYQPEVLRVIGNACRYLAPRETATVTGIGSAPQAEISPETVRASQEEEA